MYDSEHSRVLKNFNSDIWQSVPTREHLDRIIAKTVRLKEKYMIESQYLCSPMRYNQMIFEKPFGASLPIR